MSGDELFDRAVGEHDTALTKSGLDIWIGSEPTFTDRWTTLPEWTTQALGDDKLQRAEHLVRDLHADFPGGAMLRTVGRQYPGEERPRWSFGLYRYRDGQPLWQGPPDPLLCEPDWLRNAAAAELADVLKDTLSAVAPAVYRFPGLIEGEQRVVLRPDSRAAPDWTDPRLLRPSIHCGAIPKNGLRDELAGDGLLLFLLSTANVEGCDIARIELPAFNSVPMFVTALAAIARAARSLDLPALILRGFPPPVDGTVEWATVTPDPAVIEINMAPDRSVTEFLRRNRAVYQSAERWGLSPFRLYYNGAVADSGGGGQITVGGPSPGGSPFFVEPRLLPRLVRYFNRHPALSFLFAHDSIGGSGQSVRPDERGDDALRELDLALDLLDRNDAPTPEILWRSLAPFLTDPSGNAHRAELNIEKLWNPYLPGRGQLGLVEFRALRMQHTPERVASLACLLRALAALLMRRECGGRLSGWGAALHERYALPFYLEKDLGEVLADLVDGGFGLPEPLADCLMHDEFRDLATFEFEGCALRLRKAAEFWPLVGDTSSQEQGTSRLVDSSTQRLELLLCPQTGYEDRFAGWQVRVQGIDLPFGEEAGSDGVKVFGLRYRGFVPWQGLHPTLGASDSVGITLHHPGVEPACELRWHEWRPTGGAYPDWPEDLTEARARRAERLVPRVFDRSEMPPPLTAPPGSLTPWSLDLRWLPRPLD